MPDDGTHLVYVDLIEEEPLSEAGFAQTAGLTVDELGDRYKWYVMSFQPWRSVVRSGGNQRTMFRSSERYFNEADARHAVEVCFGNQSRVFLRRNEHGNVELRQPAVTE